MSVGAHLVLVVVVISNSSVLDPILLKIRQILIAVIIVSRSSICSNSSFSNSSFSRASAGLQ
jgi:hypothetical protein